ncbi:MAG: hypothetical protein A4E57_03489 [Syntrophorhabdaceae bacterium PtaU1.Bin034]|jgi:uncharacterized protein (DUF362 family)|nr:MAG: hypothetical protein A4E57_03489 [Syntrophorhabdaceae bacterium PtaU1.Bin034]
MNRRQFLKFSGAFFFINRLFVKDLWAKDMPVVAISEGRDYIAATKSVINALGGMSRFVKTGNTVVIKPNMGWDRKPEQAATTHPAVVRAIVEECIKAGAKRIRVFDNPCNDMRRSYTNSGIPATLKGLENVEVKYIEEERFKKVNLKGTFLKEWEIYGEALSADVFINVPIAKHHSLTGVTLGLKNMMGVMGGNRGYIHRQIENALADVNSVVKSHLVVIDATRILTAHGPTGGSLSDVKTLNKVIASTDIVAADAYATGLFGLKPQDIPITVTAHKRGLGEMNLERMKIVTVKA